MEVGGSRLKIKLSKGMDCVEDQEAKRLLQTSSSFLFCFLPFLPFSLARTAHSKTRQYGNDLPACSAAPIITANGPILPWIRDSKPTWSGHSDCLQSGERLGSQNKDARQTRHGRVFSEWGISGPVQSCLVDWRDSVQVIRSTHSLSCELLARPFCISLVSTPCRLLSWVRRLKKEYVDRPPEMTLQ